MFLEKLLDVPIKKILSAITILGLISFVLLTILASLLGLFEGNSEYRIFDYEFAWTAEQVNKIFKSWGSEGKHRIAIGIYFDFIYILAYVSLMFGCLLIVSRKLEGSLQTTGLYMTLMPFIAGIFDVIENINLLLMINDEAYIGMGCPFVASICAMIKFTLIGVCIIFFLISIIIIVIKKNN